jgi:hypothetical protein
MVWEYFRSLQDLERELEARAQAIEQRNPGSTAAAIEAGRLRSVIEEVKEFDREYFDELNICLGYVLYTFREHWGRTLIEHHKVEAIVLRADGPDPEIDLVDVKRWLARRREDHKEYSLEDEQQEEPQPPA